MISDILFIIKLTIAFLPFFLEIVLSSKDNLSKDIRYKQYPMPIVALVYSVILYLLLGRINQLVDMLIGKLIWVCDFFKLGFISSFLKNEIKNYKNLILLILFNILAFAVYLILKRILITIFKKARIKEGSVRGKILSIFYEYDEMDGKWYVKEHLGQARTFISVAYIAGAVASCIAVIASCAMAKKGLLAAPYYPVFAIIITGEVAFFLDGLSKEERTDEIKAMGDKSNHVTVYPLLRKPLRQLFKDKLSSEGTSVNNGGSSGGSIEDILVDLEENGGHLGRNYSSFIRTKMRYGLKPSSNYVRSGYELATGKSLLFNTPFYYKLSPYVFYAINRALILDKKVLIVLGRHGTTQDVYKWCDEGFRSATNVPNIWKIEELTDKKPDEENMPDVGIITRSAVHDMDIHMANLEFLSKVAFVVIVEPSKLIPTAQIGLNLLIKCCGQNKKITYCSVDRNCDGLVDSLSHVLMANITEVAATEFPDGMSSFMCWTADDEYIQHRIIPGISRCLGMGTEFSFVALKNQVEKATWYGGDVYPVKDEHWIAKQYYYDLLSYAQLPLAQETFDKYFITSNNMCDERVADNSYVVVEDERNNVFEVKRCFATIAEKQGFVNVISSEYMLREYMTDNTLLFNTDAKAIPYITADFAGTNRNRIFTICLNLCVTGVVEKDLRNELRNMGLDSRDLIGALWTEMCKLFRSASYESEPDDVIVVKHYDTDKEYTFTKNTTIQSSREYSVRTGRFETVYHIKDKNFTEIILEDLRNAKYISERSEDNPYLGGELRGHVYQKYLPGQFFTLNGKYYEMISATHDNCIQVRRASEYINGRISYRQVREYVVDNIVNSEYMGDLKTVNDIDIYYQYADFSVKTPAYWKLHANNNFKDGSLIEINGVPERNYCHKQVLKLDFSKLGESFTDSIRYTLTNLINEAFVTLFADNQPYISAVTPGEISVPLTYSISASDDCGLSDKAIYIIEDSQLDLGLLIAVERNIHRILQIIADYLNWNQEKIDESIELQNAEEKRNDESGAHLSLSEIAKQIEDKKVEDAKEKNIFRRFGRWIKGLFKKKDNDGSEEKKRKKEEKKRNKKEEKLKKKKERTEKKAVAEKEKQIKREEKEREKKKIEEAARIAAESVKSEPEKEEPDTDDLSESENEPEAEEIEGTSETDKYADTDNKSDDDADEDTSDDENDDGVTEDDSDESVDDESEPETAELSDDGEEASETEEAAESLESDVSDNVEDISGEESVLDDQEHATEENNETEEVDTDE